MAKCVDCLNLTQIPEFLCALENAGFFDLIEEEEFVSVESDEEGDLADPEDEELLFSLMRRDPYFPKHCLYCEVYGVYNADIDSVRDWDIYNEEGCEEFVASEWMTRSIGSEPGMVGEREYTSLNWKKSLPDERLQGI